MSEYTSGEWRVVGKRQPDDGPEEPVFVDGPGDENCVNTLRYSVAVCRGPDAESNARLIAAAPEIRKAAEFALSTLESLDPHGKKDGQTPQAKELLEQAIAKAEGEEVER